MKVDFSLDGQVAVVTGAAPDGIGEAYASALADAGASVVCADLRADAATEVADAITAAGGSAVGVGVDITDAASVEAMVGAAVSAFGGIDILVNNAGLMVEAAMGGTTLDFPADLWDKTFDVNLKGSWTCARAVVPQMVARGGGSIVNQSSIGALPAEGVYGISKLAVIGLTTNLARELGPSNITVNCIAPGLTKSAAGNLLTPADSPYVQAMEARAAVHLRGEPSELCGPLLLFVSPAGRWITGQVMVVDGGCVMRG